MRITFLSQIFPIHLWVSLTFSSLLLCYCLQRFTQKSEAFTLVIFEFKELIEVLKMSGVLYHHFFSPPSRMAFLAVRNLGLNIQIKNIDIYKGEQHSPEFLKVNPLNQVPAYIEGSFILAESKAIATYLANANKSPLYPADCKQRALIDSKLYYDSTVSFPAVRNFVVSIMNLLNPKSLNSILERCL